MSFKLIVKTSNAAFDDSPEVEVASILKEVAQRLLNGYKSGTVRDTNGNNVGTWSLK